MNDSAHVLSFGQPAREWLEALPLGNGRIGAMVYGDPLAERIQVNDGTAWSGGPDAEFTADRPSPQTAASALAAARSAIEAEEWGAADAELRRLQHRYSQAFVPFVDLRVTSVSRDERSRLTDYVRSLDFRNATQRSTWRIDGAEWVSSAFVSAADRVLVWSIDSSVAQGVDLDIELTSVHPVERRGTRGDADELVVLRLPSDVVPTHDYSEQPIVYDADGQQAVAAVHVQHDGRLSRHGDVLRLRDATTASIILTTATGFRGMGRRPDRPIEDITVDALAVLAAAASHSTESLWLRHRTEHARLYDRAELVLESPECADVGVRHTDVRLARVNAAGNVAFELDPALISLLFNYGRYLLISASRPGGTPANLQGIWNAAPRAPWSSNYTVNINLQMNYWMTGPVALSELAGPLVDFIEALADRGRATARDFYAAPGWVAHHNSDIWGYSLPVGQGAHDPKWAFWPFASAWLLRHLWNQLEFGADDAFAERVYPLFRGGAQFFLHWLQERPDGTLGTVPSTSPENSFITADGVEASAGISSTHDLVAIRDLFTTFGLLAERLGIEEDDVLVEAREASTRIPGPTVDDAGRVREWAMDVTYPEPHHRHVSHLVFLYPGTAPVPAELCDAAARSLDDRLDDSTGWSLAWKLALRARLGQADKVADLTRLALRDVAVDRGPQAGGLYANLFSAHPPFQIDGNLGFTAGIAEALLQSHRDRIELLPSIPPQFGPGRARGLIARGGVRVDLAWSADAKVGVRLVTARVVALSAGQAGPRIVSFGGSERLIDVTLTPMDVAPLFASVRSAS